MIHCRFKRDKQQTITMLEVSGHANAGPYGSDIVCAAVSAIVISTINGIEKLSGVAPILDIDNDNEGYIYLSVREDLTTDEALVTQILLENAVLGLQDIQENYGEFVKVSHID